MSDDWDHLTERYAKFVSDRDWDQFHTPQNLAIAASVEANELLENFLWFEDPSSESVQEDDELMAAVRDEMADVMIYMIGLANQLDIDLQAAVAEKIERNEERFDEERVDEINEYLTDWQEDD
ncbi:nucleotide pyrophosphohydrolase [Halorhabdus rudnickae]|uniref:nucleotide pyrophosphohydrolase n=1 Tax=Halorhabdus rudnickae TaxID=1775544 RepID=UPI001083D0E6|nr:nucleotide pyrophosphohydrolase [Halorhabdus rudnickae]